MVNDFPFLKLVGETLYINTPMLRIYLPKDYFGDGGISEMYEDKVQTIGMFYFSTHSSIDAPLDDTKNMYFLKLPLTFTIQFDKIEDAKITIRGVEDSFRVISCYNDNVFIENINFVQNGGNVMKFLNLLNTAKLSRVKYSDLFELFMSTMFLNNVDLQVPSTILEGIITELCRQPNNISEPFRQMAGRDPNVDEFSYRAISSKLLAHVASTFASIDYEDFNKALTVSSERTRSQKKDRVSPVEKVIYF